MCYQCREQCRGERCNTLVNFFSQWFLAMARRNGTSNGIQPWHPAMAPQQWRPAMAPSNGPQQWHPLRTPAMAPSNGTLAWHPAMAPSNGTQQWHPAMAPSMAPSNGTPAMAPSYGTQLWHLTSHCRLPLLDAMVRRHCWAAYGRAPLLGAIDGCHLVGCHCWTHPPWHPAMAPYHGIRQWHHTMASSECFITTPPKLVANPPSYSKWPRIE